MPRAITRRYADPLDAIWIGAAERIGLTVRRTPDAFATTDGRGTLAIGTDETLDADDCLAQMIFHELCHSLVQGPESFDAVDWGLCNESVRDLRAEHACLRTQACLASRVGLRDVLAPTTEHRAFFDRLGDDPLDGATDDVTRARRAVFRASRPPWAPHLMRALEATAAVARAAAPFVSEESLLAATGAPRARHPAGGWTHPVSGGRCGDCAWRGERCAVTQVAVQPRWPACEAFVATLDCRACGACCREGFDVVELDAGERFVAEHAQLVERVDGRWVLRRVDGRCPPLSGDGVETTFTCAVYDDRPRSCRELPKGGDSCLLARRRVGLSAG